MKNKVGIIGASGYTGHELLKILQKHPSVEIEVLNSRSYAGKKVSLLYEDFEGTETYSGLSYDDINTLNLDLIFLALPHLHAMDAVEKLNPKFKIIDLSADHRFKDANLYKQVYGKEMKNTDKNWAYGLPELFKQQIKSAHFVANPGCYATGSILATYPIQAMADRIIMDCKSGWSGAGKNSVYAENRTVIEDNLIAYNLTKHRHKYEVQQFIKTKLSFTPHVFDTFQGMMCTAHIILKNSHKPEDIKQLYEEFYKDSAFTRIKDSIPKVADTQQTNYCDIGGFEIDETGQLVVVATLDNLWKGASGQAVQNMNLMLGLDETAGLANR